MTDPTPKPEHILFITGRLAHDGLNSVLENMRPDFNYTVHSLGLSVAALMTTAMIKRRLKETYNADCIILPGRFRGHLDELSEHFGIPVERGPDEFKDLPLFFGYEKKPTPLDRYDVAIFAEIVNAPDYSPEQILTIAQRYRADGADVIDIGFMPDTPFLHLDETIKLLKHNDFKISIDTHDPESLIKAAQSGADYILSLKRDTLWVAGETDAIPIIIPDTPQQIETLYESIDILLAKNQKFIADPILEPIHCGFTESIVRYHETRRRYPQVEIMMGIGNLTELTHADSAGITAMLMGIVSEIGIRQVLTTEVSEHCRKVVRETDLARRIMFATRKDHTPPTGVSTQLMMLHERKPFLATAEEIKSLADKIKDRNMRIQASAEGIHVYNRSLYRVATDPFDFYLHLGVEDDGGHAFYLGVELARAQIAHQLGKRYAQDEELSWGCAVEREQEDLTAFKEVGPTQYKRYRKQKDEGGDDADT